MKYIISKWLLGFLFLGVGMVILCNLFGNNLVPVLQEEQIAGTSLYWYKVDFTQYFQNLGDQFGNIQKIILNLPERTPKFSFTVEALVNNLLLMVDYTIMSINFQLYPLRLAFWWLSCIFSIFGVQTTGEIMPSGISWILEFNKFMQNSFAIPYI